MQPGLGSLFVIGIPQKYVNVNTVPENHLSCSLNSITGLIEGSTGRGY